MADFIETERLTSVARKIAELEPCLYYHRVTADQVLLALAEFGDIWPEAVRADMIVDAVEEAEREVAEQHWVVKQPPHSIFDIGFEC